MPDSNSPNKRPPNYSSRPMQVRLLLLVGGLMLVLVMMDEARKPKNWMWMGFESGAGEESEEAGQDRTVQVSPRLADLFSNRDDDNSLFSAMANESHADVDASDGESDGEEATRRQITERCFKQLNDEDLQCLFLDVQSLLDLEPLSPETLEDRKRIASRIDRVVQGELQEYRRISLKQLDEEQIVEIDNSQELPEEWQTLLASVEEYFSMITSQLTASGSAELTVGQLRDLASFQATLDAIALAQIEDNTLGPRSREQHAWYRVFERLDETAGAVKSDALPQVTVYNLAEDPSEYRGKWVRFDGQIRSVKQVTLAANREGYQDYYELWVRPGSGPDVPVCVYTLQLPEGFEKPVDDELLEVNEPTTIAGCFFKNMSYRSVGGLRVSPLILAVEPQWQPVVAQETSDSEMPTWQNVGTLALLSGLVACWVAWFVYRSTRVVSKQRNSGRIGGACWLLPLMIAVALCSDPEQLLAQGDVADGNEASSGVVASDDGSSSPARPPWLLGSQSDQNADKPIRFFDLFQDIRRSELDRLGDYQTLDPNEAVVQQVLSRLDLLGPRWLENRSATLDATKASEMIDDPSQHRGAFLTLRGRIESVEQVELTDATWDQFDRDVIYRVTIEVPGASDAKQRCVALCNRVPPAWGELQFPIDEAKVTGMFVHLEPGDGQQAALPVLLASEAAWFPVETEVSPWQSFWCGLGLDYGRWSPAKNLEGRPLQADDGPCFYGLLARLESAQQALAKSKLDVSEFDLFEVLKNPNAERGVIVRFDGIAKRVTRISTGEDLHANDEGITGYYQIDLLVALDGRRVRLGTAEKGTTMTGRYPMTLCVVELPSGLKEGEGENTRIRGTASFYRNWKYRSEYLRRVDEDLRQLSPLMIGIEIESGSQDDNAMWLTQIAVFVFVAAVGLTGIGFVYFRWSDSKYDQARAQQRADELPDQLDWVEEGPNMGDDKEDS